MSPCAQLNVDRQHSALRRVARTSCLDSTGGRDDHPTRVATRTRGLAPSFTLIEVVVALALCVTLLVAVQGLLVNTYRAANQIERRATDADARTLAFDLLRQDLESQPAGGGLVLNDNVLRFTTLNALQSPRLAARHAVAVRYALEPSSDGSLRLTRRESELSERDRKRPGVILADRIAEVSFAVYDGQQWHGRWPLRVARTAYALRISVTWPDGSQSQETIQVAPLRWSRHDE